MSFTSFDFLLYFPVAVLLFNIVPQRYRTWYLLLVSYLFYAIMQPVYLLLMIGVTGMTYGFSRWISSADNDVKRGRITTCGIIFVLLPLFFFKYYNFVNEQITSLTGLTACMPKLEWILPVGISFYTFMAIGYLVDVSNEEVDVEKNIGMVGLFLSFFPIVLSGPIERAGNMLPQFNNLHKSTPDDLSSGAKMMLWGYFMKLCVADRLGLYIDNIFADTGHYNGTTLLFTSFLYPIRIYADFAGYSILAMGVARCMGIKIMENFHRPFFATSMSEFWRRWHISLITWITDYIYTPMAFSLRKWGVWGIVTSIMLAFFISGVWHGAAWTFIVWGIVQGIYLSVEALTKKLRTNCENKYHLVGKWWYTALCCLIVFILFAFSQIFAHCADLDEAGLVIKKIFTDFGQPSINAIHCFLGLLCTTILFAKDFIEEFFPGISLFNNKNIVVRWLSYIVCLGLIVLLGNLGDNSFIYFKF